MLAILCNVLVSDNKPNYVVSVQTSSGGVSLAVGAERKRGPEEQDALQLAAQLRARSQGGEGASTKNGAHGSEGSTDKDKKLKNLRKVS